MKSEREKDKGEPTVEKIKDLDLSTLTAVSEAVDADENMRFIVTGSYATEALTEVSSEHGDMDSNVFCLDIKEQKEKVVSLMNELSLPNAQISLVREKEERLAYDIQAGESEPRRLEIQFVEVNAIDDLDNNFQLKSGGIVPTTMLPIKNSENKESTYRVKSLPYAIATWVIRTSGVAENTKRAVRDSDFVQLLQLLDKEYNYEEVLQSMSQHPQMPSGMSEQAVFDTLMKKLKGERGLNDQESFHDYIEEKHSTFGVEPNSIEDVIQQTLGASAQDVKRIIAGGNNEVYDVLTGKGSYILRISRSPKARYKTEKWALDESAKVGIPVPNILHIGQLEDKQETLDYCIENKLVGVSMSELIRLNQLEPEQVEGINFQTGVLLAQIHTIETQGYGKFAEPGRGKYESWSAFMLKYSTTKREETVELASKAGLDSKDVERAIGILEERSAAYQDISPRLLHFDYSPKQVLVEDGQVTGIVDFEGSMSGDPLYELAWKAYFEEASKAFLDGYGSIAEIPDNYEDMINLYGLRIGLDLVRWYSLNEHTAGMAHAKKKMEENISYFNNL